MFEEPMPLVRQAPNLSSLPPLQRIHRKESSHLNLWQANFADENGKFDIESLKKRLPENKWRKLLEELYTDKKYFDYVKSKWLNTCNVIAVSIKLVQFQIPNNNAIMYLDYHTYIPYST